MKKIDTVEPDQIEMDTIIASMPDTESVAHFKASPEIRRLPIRFDIQLLREALAQVSGEDASHGFENLGDGFKVLSLTRRPGSAVADYNDLSGRYYLRVDESMQEHAREDLVQEIDFSEFVDAYKGTYFEHVHNELKRRYPIGRMRVLMKDRYSCNSWHRDPEPRIHIPIVTNPGSLFVVNHHCTHLPADGSTYFTDTRAYHTAINGGESQRVHLVAALAYPPVES